MPDQPQCTPAAVPTVDPAAWEEHEGFRETFLHHVTDAGANATLREFGRLLFNLILEYASLWPQSSEAMVRTELRAALADLRHLQGFLATLGREHLISSLSATDIRRSQLAGRESAALGKIADRIEAEID